jgi:GDP-L-fucose synthase
MSPTEPFSDPLPPQARIFVAGHRGMVGSALVRELRAQGYHNLVTRGRDELELTDQSAVKAFFRREPIDAVFLAAARVGGILANNTYRAEFIYENLMIAANVIHAAYLAGVRRLLFLGSSCIYPRNCPQPMREEHLMSGPLEPTNEPYAVAKIAGIALCDAYNRRYGTFYRCAMPTNLFGPGDTYDLESSHVLPALLRKFHLARLAAEGQWDRIQRDQERFGKITSEIMADLKEGKGPVVRLWGTGSPRREFLHVEDAAAACVYIMRSTDADFAAALSPSPEEKLSGSAQAVTHLNMGLGCDITIRELAERVAALVGYEGRVAWDADRPDGMPRKLLDSSRLARLGWRPQIDIDSGIRSTYHWYCEQAP